MSLGPTSDYLLATGDIGAARLAIVERVFGPDTHRTMEALGIGSGMRIADIGCGTGNTTKWFAARVGSTGEVVAVDISADQLAVAKRATEEDGYRNVRFVESSAYSTGLPGDSFDVVHCRLLLCHLDRPLDAIREMVSLTKPGGLVVCVDFSIRQAFACPPQDCYSRAIDIMALVAQKRGADLEIGPKLPGLLSRAGLLHADLRMFHPGYVRGAEKRLGEYTFLEASPALRKAGLIEAAELERLTHELSAVAADETIVVAPGCIVVSWARKAG